MLKAIWDFFQNEVLGMKWLYRLIDSGLTAAGLDTSSKLGGSIRFFMEKMELLVPDAKMVRY